MFPGIPCLVDDSRHGSPLGFYNVVPAIDESLVAFLDEGNSAAEVFSKPENIFDGSENHGGAGVVQDRERKERQR